MTLICFFLINGARLFAQGPPFQVDDPVPVDFKHYEFYKAQPFANRLKMCVLTRPLSGGFTLAVLA
jgi:hypothetical protein